jgi:hypothetical protein
MSTLVYFISDLMIGQAQRRALTLHGVMVSPHTTLLTVIRCRLPCVCMLPSYNKYIFIRTCNSFIIYHLFVTQATLLWQFIKGQ